MEWVFVTLDELDNLPANLFLYKGLFDCFERSHRTSKDAVNVTEVHIVFRDLFSRLCPVTTIGISSRLSYFLEEEVTMRFNPFVLFLGLSPCLFGFFPCFGFETEDDKPRKAMDVNALNGQLSDFGQIIFQSARKTEELHDHVVAVLIVDVVDNTVQILNQGNEALFRNLFHCHNFYFSATLTLKIIYKFTTKCQVILVLCF